MTSVIRSMISIAGLSASLVGAPPGVSLVAGSRQDRTLAATTSLGQTYLAGREMQIDLTFASGKSAKGMLHILFEPRSGFYIQVTGFLPGRPGERYSWIDALAPRTRFAVTPDRIVILTLWPEKVEIIESREKAASLDEAEAKSLQWNGDHLAALEARTHTYKSYGYVHEAFRLSRFEFPKGFFQSEYWSVGSPPIRLIDFVRKDDFHWEVIMQCTETGQRAKMSLFRRGGTFRLIEPGKTWARSLISAI
jgi:hypothetical protein